MELYHTLNYKIRAILFLTDMKNRTPFKYIYHIEVDENPRQACFNPRHEAKTTRLTDSANVFS